MEFFRESFYHLLAWLIIGHYVADYALQSDFMAKAKDHTTELGKVYWKHVLAAHAIIHGGFVFLFTGSIWLFFLEAVFHARIDYTKCDKKITLDEDQLRHIYCKLLWALMATVGYAFAG